MADKSFEQRVQEELGPLKMRPDENVWTKVEAGLHQEKKRRRFFWLFFFTGAALLSAGGYWMGKHITSGRSGAAQQTVSQAAQPDPLQTPPVTVQRVPEPQAQQESSSVNAEPSSSPIARAHTVKIAGAPSFRIATSSQKQNLTHVSNPVAGNHNDGTEDPHTSATAMSQQAAITQSGAQETAVTGSIVTPPGGQPKTEAKGTDVIKDEKATTEAFATPAAPDSAGKENATSTVTSPRKKRRWTFDVSAAAGRSELASSIFPFDGSKRYDPVFSSPTTGAPSGGNGTPAPAVDPGFGFGIWLGAQKELNKTFSVGLSAGYTQYTTSTMVGARVDSTVFFASQNLYNSLGYYYSNTSRTPYTNRYHYFQLGAVLQTSFTLFRKVDARWQLGGGAALLVGSNGVHYDVNTGRSFRNNTLFTKWQPYLSTGIDFGFGKQPLFYVGPHWLLHLGQLTTSGSGEHLTLGSLRVTFVLPRKK